MFTVPGTYGASSSYKVAYHSNSTSGNQVEIAAAQTQETPNTTHFGTAGDNVITAATPGCVGSTNGYVFKMEHKAAYYTTGTDQPTVNNQTGSAYPQAGDGDRYYNTTIPAVGEGAHGLFNPSSAQHVSNVNELSWYVMKCDPRWDPDELWTTFGHLYKGGMWFKKKANISGFRNDKAADNSTDLRTVFASFLNIPANISSTPISAADQSGYFYLPALGYYLSGSPASIGDQAFDTGCRQVSRSAITTHTTCISTVVACSCSTAFATTVSRLFLLSNPPAWLFPDAPCG